MAARAEQDQTLIQRFLDGDRAAFNELMRFHEDRVFSVCLRIMGDRERALDATQETFVTLYRKADRFRGESAFSTWLYRVATNTCYDLLRKYKRSAADPLPDYHDPVDTTTDDSFTAVDIRPELATALDQLPEEFHAAVVLVDLNDFAIAEAAAVLDIPPGTVKSRVFRGRRLLAEALRNLSDTSDRPMDDHDA